MVCSRKQGVGGYLRKFSLLANVQHFVAYCSKYLYTFNTGLSYYEAWPAIIKDCSWDKHRKAKFQQLLEMTQLHIHTVEYVVLRLLYNEGTLLNVQTCLSIIVCWPQEIYYPYRNIPALNISIGLYTITQKLSKEIKSRRS